MHVYVSVCVCVNVHVTFFSASCNKLEWVHSVALICSIRHSIELVVLSEVQSWNDYWLRMSMGLVELRFKLFRSSGCIQLRQSADSLLSYATVSTPQIFSLSIPISSDLQCIVAQTSWEGPGMRLCPHGITTICRLWSFSVKAHNSKGTASSLHMGSHYTHQIILVLSQYLHAYWILYN